MPSSTHRPLRGGIVVAALLSLPTVSLANMAPQYRGDLVGEPSGVKAVAITREDLTIDLRPLAHLRPVQVRAVYHLYNSGPKRRLHLLFVTGAPGVEEFSVRLGDQPIASKPQRRSLAHWPFPERWGRSETVRGIDLPDIVFESH